MLFKKNKEKCRYKMAIIQRMVTKKGFKNKDKKVYKIFQKKKNTKREYGRNRYNMSEED